MADKENEKKEDEKEENKTKAQSKLEGLDEDARTKIVEKWKKKFKTAEQFREAYQAKWLRMWELYRAYNANDNYAYDTNLMPPIAFEIVETVKPRLASARMNVRILPRFKKDAESKSLESWDDKIKYDLDTIKFKDRKIDWINSSLQFGDGVLGLVWKTNKDGEGDPFAWVQDLWLFYPDPEATSLQEDSRYEIVQIFKTKQKLEEEEDARGEKKIYRNLDKVENKKIEDPRKERYEILTKKMGQVAKGESDEGETSEEKITENKVELLQIWDHEENEILVIANREELIRYEKNPYMKINNGRIFIDLSDHAMLWELWSVGHIEPVETTIHEIADSRNQAMDDIVFTLDPIRKVRKEAHLTADDIVHEPGAVWQLKKADDVIIERSPPVDRQWLDKDALLRKEIQMSLAISEYAMGLPKSKQEPMGKVDLLLLQTNIRFSLLLRQFEISMTQVVNNLIEMNGEFLTKNKELRLIGKEIEFKDFKTSDAEVRVDARVEIEAKRDSTPDQRQREIMALYKIFVAEDKPDENAPKEVKRWKSRKRTLQKMILEEFGKEQYEDLILGLEEEEEEGEEAPEEEPKAPAKAPVGGPGLPPGGAPEAPGGAGTPPGAIRSLMQKIPLLNKIIK